MYKGLVELLSSGMYQIDWYDKNPMISFEELRGYTITLQTGELKKVESRAPKAKAYYIRPAHVETRGVLFDHSKGDRDLRLLDGERGCSSPSKPAQCKVLKPNPEDTTKCNYPKPIFGYLGSNQHWADVVAVQGTGRGQGGRLAMLVNMSGFQPLGFVRRHSNGMIDAHRLFCTITSTEGCFHMLICLDTSTNS
jgi:hypothetical protein